MNSSHITVRDLIGVYRRRRKFLYIPLLIITLIAITAGILLPNRYESSTTILVQREEILNPLVSVDLAMRMAQDDGLATVNEIIFSRLTINKFIDSLGLNKKVRSEEEAQNLNDHIQTKIQTERRGKDSFRITYTDRDPHIAQRASQTLSNLFIQSILQVESQRNDLAVQFYEKKLEDIRQKFEESQRKVVSALQSRVGSMPVENRMLYGQVETTERKISDLEARMKTYQQQIAVLRTYPAALRTESGKQKLYELTRMDVPFAIDLQSLMSKYDDFIRRYTIQYPEVEKLETQIVDLLDRMRKVMESELTKLRPQRADLQQHLATTINDLKQSSVNERIGSDKGSDYETYKKLYDEMTIKLEQAQAARDIGMKGSTRFIVIDPAIVPATPSKPNRPQIILGGLGLGIFVGLLAMIMKEMFDSTIRTPRDILMYQKPVIALIAEGQEEHRN